MPIDFSRAPEGSPAVASRAIALALSGAALALAFPLTAWDGLAWFAATPVVVIALGVPPRAAFGWGWLTGSVFFLTLLRWLNFTFRVYSAIPWPLTWIPTLALAGYCGLYVGVFGAAVSWVGRRRSPAWALLAAPFVWVATEWVRGHFLGGFPWGLLGYSQWERLAVIQVAELGGIYAVSLVVIAVNVAIAGCLVLRRDRAIVGVALAALLVGSTLAFGRARLREAQYPEEMDVAVMQPSIEQPLKWNEGHTAETLRIYATLTKEAGRRRPQLIVWPETASPTLLRRDPWLIHDLTTLSATLATPLLVGSIDEDDVKPPHDFNTAFLLTDRGIVGRYDKMHLVPFGEYVPLSRVIGFVRGWAEFISDLTPGSRAVVFPGPPAPFAVVICYEGIFPELVRTFVKGGARVIVNMTNDAWFGHTSGPWQHLTMYPFRAVEHRTAIVRAANTGVSAFIAPTGRIVRALGLFERGTMAERVPLRAGQTLYTRFGDWVAYLALAVSVVALAVALGARRR